MAVKHGLGFAADTGDEQTQVASHGLLPLRIGFGVDAQLQVECSAAFEEQLVDRRDVGKVIRIANVAAGDHDAVQSVAADLHGLDNDTAQKRIAEVIELFELERFIDQLTERFSHGMRQRTVFASAMLPHPQLLIVDEPTVGLDPRSVRQLKNILREYTRQGNTVFLSSHSLDVVEQIADRIGIILGGKLIGCGSLEDLRSQAALNGPLEEVFLRLTQPEEYANSPQDAAPP